MRHEEVIENLSDYVEDSLEPGMKAAVDNHIRGCAECYREAASLREMMVALSETPLLVEPPGRFHDDVMRRVRLTERAHQKTPAGLWERIGWGWRSAGLAGAAVALAVVVWGVGPLHSGAPAGFVSGPSIQQAAPSANLTVSAPVLAAGQDAVVRVTLPTSFTGQLVAQTSEGLSLPSSTELSNGLGRQLWQGAATGPVLVTVRPSTAGQLETLSLRLISASDSSETARMDVFLPVQTSTEGARALRSTGSTRDVAAAIALTFGVSVAADAADLDAPGAVSVQASNASEALQSLAAQRALRLTESAGTFNLAK
ncbi:MAG TPA: zf-HC2 domain-containing protein [Armatimonadota bacterium]